MADNRSHGPALRESFRRRRNAGGNAIIARLLDDTIPLTPDHCDLRVPGLTFDADRLGDPFTPETDVECSAGDGLAGGPSRLARLHLFRVNPPTYATKEVAT